MPSYSVVINDISQDENFFVWGSGQDLRKFTGTSWEYYNFANSAVPNSFPYYLDTRCVDVDPEGNVWCGVAQGPTAGTNQVAAFYINSVDVKKGDSWNFSDLGTFSVPQEISFIYACPFGDDVYAFSTPLNGIGGTGTTGYTEINGVTGGRLFTYYKQTDIWKEVLPGYTWPHVYDMIAQGYDGKTYFYFVGTSEGLFIIPQGQLESIVLQGGERIPKQGQIYTTATSGIISNYIYSLDLDENGNLWIGTDSGLSFFNGMEFFNYPGATGPITKVKSRPNGHVFYAQGDGELSQGTGLWHFNGSTTSVFNTANSTISNNNILDLELVGHNVNQNGLVVYENSFWVLGLNNLSSFNYDQPHVYGSSKYEGATGWNFTYFSPTGGTAAPLPKINKYTWAYPEWQTYQDEYLALKFPGLDPRNLFLTTSLEAIADGRAGKQPYWNNWPLPTFEQQTEAETIQTPLWSWGVTSGITNGTTGSINFTCSASLKTKDGLKYYLGGYIQGSLTATLGYYNFSTPAVLQSQNPTIGGSSSPAVLNSSSYDDGETGFIVCYGEGGYVDCILPIRGYQTRVQSLSPSEDGEFIYASGIYNRFIENGPYVWDSLESENVLRGGPTGAPAGVTTSNVVGLTSGLYPWVYGSSGAFISADWLYVQGSQGSPAGRMDVSFSGNQQTWENTSNITLNYTDYVSVLQSNLNNAVTTNVISLYGGSGTTGFYRIDGIRTIGTGSPSGLSFDVSWTSGATGSFIPTSTQTTVGVYEYVSNSFPLLSNTINRAQYWNSNDVIANAFWVAKIGRDLGNDFSFTDLGITGGFSYDVRTNFRGVDFRTFPARYQQSLSAGDVKNSKLANTDYSVNLGLESTVFFYGATGGNGELSTLTGDWDRFSDYSSTPNYFLGSTNQISQNWTSDSLIGYLRLSTENFGIMASTTSESLYPGTGANSSLKILSSVQSLPTDNTTIFTGVSEKNFNIGSVGLTGATSGYTPFYFIISKTGTGVTGAFLSGVTGSQATPQSSRDESTYYVTSVFGGSADYFGESYIASATGAHFYTAQITEQGVDKKVFVDYIDLEANKVTPWYTNPNRNGQFLIGFLTTSGATASRSSIFKSNRDGKIEDLKFFTSSFENPYSGNFNFQVNSDPDDNVFISAYTSGATAEGFYTFGPSAGKVALSEQYTAELGINLGNIISRPGSGAWTWCDVHSTDGGMQVPLMSTVFFSNYASNIYGKQNNVWILTDSRTGQEILNVKSTPYFIFTFTEIGNYTIYNKVEDSAGNVYSITKPGYIEVVNHKEKNPDDRNPDQVDSFDYGVPDAFAGRDYEVKKLGKSLAEEELRILKQNQIPFGVEVVIPNNPDATFRDIEP
jgi:hypothetical protein